MGRANAAAGEHMVKSPPQRVHRGDYLLMAVGDNPGFPQLNAAFGELFRQMVKIRVPGSA